MEKIKIVSVVSNLDMYKKCIQDNTSMNKHELTFCDNTKENIGIPKRYNDFIKKNVNGDSFWIIFCHQDFGFDKDPQKILSKLDKNFIYGPIGVIPQKQFLSIRRFHPKFNVIKTRMLGQIRQFKKKKQDFFLSGEFIDQPVTVETLDCCCLIVHSSLVKKYNLRFDENLDWHLYVEDFSMTARIKHNILTKAVQFECFHIGQGDINQDFNKSWKYMLKKHGLQRIISTCGPKRDRLKLFGLIKTRKHII